MVPRARARPGHLDADGHRRRRRAAPTPRVHRRPTATAGATGRRPSRSGPLAEHTVTDPFAHAERLMPLARAALAEAGRTLRRPGRGGGRPRARPVHRAAGRHRDRGRAGRRAGHPGARRAQPRRDGSAARRDGAGDLLVVTDARRREVYLSAYAADGRRVLGPLVVAPGRRARAAGRRAGCAPRCGHRGRAPACWTGVVGRRRRLERVRGRSVPAWWNAPPSRC